MYVIMPIMRREEDSSSAGQSVEEERLRPWSGKEKEWIVAGSVAAVIILGVLFVFLMSYLERKRDAKKRLETSARQWPRERPEIPAI
jgi:hypothetical protein